MIGSTKASPKACGCESCKRGKSSEGGQYIRKKEERAFRAAAKIALRKGCEDIPVAPHGTYTD